MQIFSRNRSEFICARFALHLFVSFRFVSSADRLFLLFHFHLQLFQINFLSDIRRYGTENTKPHSSICSWINNGTSYKHIRRHLSFEHIVRIFEIFFCSHFCAHTHSAHGSHVLYETIFKCMKCLIRKRGKKILKN